MECDELLSNTNEDLLLEMGARVIVIESLPPPFILFSMYFLGANPDMHTLNSPGNIWFF